MKMKSVKAFLSIMTAASLAVSAPAAVFAEDAAAQEAEAQDSDGEATAEDFTIAFDGGELSVTNQTTQTIKEAKLVEAAADEQMTAKKQITAKKLLMLPKKQRWILCLQRKMVQSILSRM